MLNRRIFGTESLEPTVPPSGHALLPHIKGLTEALTRVLLKHDIKVCNRPLKSLQHAFPSVKHRPPPEEQTTVVYKTPYKDCSWNYIGETGRSLKTMKAEHTQNVKHSNVAKHAWSLDMAIHLTLMRHAEVIDKGNFRTRKTLESWHNGLVRSS